MRDALAERLLATVMGWAADDVALERPDLQAMAMYKYDEYQQFSPGMRFVESLALWLSQFKTIQERQIAYRFVKRRLLFCSVAEINHLVSIAYPDYIRPHLLRSVAAEESLNPFHVGKVAASRSFRVRQRQCLFLGLSDGARMDVFRRSNSSDVSHEQILQTYEISAGRVNNLLGELRKDLKTILGADPEADDQKFRTIVLLDDLSASGTSYLTKDDSGNLHGKIGTFYQSITNPTDASAKLADLQKTEILLVLYVATEKAVAHLKTLFEEIWNSVGARCRIVVVHTLSDAICIADSGNDEMEPLLQTYYDATIEDEHTRKGGKDVKHGFAGCGLPLVLSHNTPNNSVYLLWAESQRLRALFPRVSRHRRDS